ncbi:hypothetical protein INR49_001910 [Caranx melampygus]|nr:hypothetical protein INR49_001910 [Caranx melampygus]
MSALLCTDAQRHPVLRGGRNERERDEEVQCVDPLRQPRGEGSCPLTAAHSSSSESGDDSPAGGGEQREKSCEKEQLEVQPTTPRLRVMRINKQLFTITGRVESAAMEAVPRMPMIWLDLKEAGEFQFSPSVRQFILKNYGENPDNYNEQLKKLETLRQSAVNVTRDFEGCSTLRKYFGQLHYLQSRVPMGASQEAAVPISWVRVQKMGMKVSCTHFQCSAGAFSYLRDNFSHNFSVDMSHQILNLNINLMLGQAQECLLEKSMLDNRKSFLVARISAQGSGELGDGLHAGKIQKDWKKLVQMKIYYFAAIAHLAYLQSSLDKLSEAIKLAKGQPDSVQEALRFTMDVIGAPLVKALPVNPTDPTVTGPDLFAKLVPMAAHEASSLYSEEKAKLLRDVMAKIESKNETLEQFMDSLGLEPETVDNLDMYSHIPPVLMEKCAALSVRPDTVKSLIQSMQGEVHPAAQGQALAEIRRDLEKYMEAHEKASFTNTELHRAMNLHISNLRLLGGHWTV